MKYRNIIFVSLLLIFSSCSRNDKQSEHPALDTAKGFYEDGSLKFEMPMRNGMLDGAYKKYYPNGNLEMNQNYEDGILKGYSKFFYENSTLKEEVYFVGEKPFGHAYYYYPSGSLETYSSFDFMGNARYVRKYDERGNIIKDQGAVLGQMLVKEADSLVLLFSYAKPPHTDIIVRAQVMEGGDLITRNISLNKRTGDLILDKGLKGRVIIIGELKDSTMNNTLAVDTLFYPER